MDLELADYQRTVQSLENDVSSRDTQLVTAAQEAQKLQETINSLRSQLGEYLSLCSSVECHVCYYTTFNQ